GVEMDHGLFAVNVFARFHSVDRGLLVPVIGGANDDGVDVFADKNFVVVAGGEDVVAPELFAVSEAAVVAVGDGDQFDAGNFNGGFGIAHSLPAGADESDLDVVVSGNRFGGLVLSRG